jgi:hypothetical protein
VRQAQRMPVRIASFNTSHAPCVLFGRDIPFRNEEIWLLDWDAWLSESVPSLTPLGVRLSRFSALRTFCSCSHSSLWCLLRCKQVWSFHNRFLVHTHFHALNSPEVRPSAHRVNRVFLVVLSVKSVAPERQISATNCACPPIRTVFG